MIPKILSPLKWWRALCLIVFFCKEIIVANLQVAWLVAFVPNRKIFPGIARMPLKAESNLEIFLLTTMITLTPGTASLWLTSDRKSLILYVLHSADVEQTIRSIQDSFERRLLEVLR